MGRLLVPLGGGGGASSDECTVVANDILKGKTTITKDSDDEIVEGTLELTGNAEDKYVAKGKTYYNVDAHEKRTGTLELTGTATDGHVLSGKTYYNTDTQTKRTGTMTNNGAKTASLNCGGSYTIPPGYHNGSGKVTANSLSSQTSATAAAGNILSGKTAWVNGSKVTGKIASQSGGTYTPSGSVQTIYCSGKYMTGNITFNAIPSGYVNVNGNADLFNNGSFGTIAGGAKTVGVVPTHDRMYCYQYRGIISNRMRWTRESSVYAATGNSQQSIVFKKKIPFQYYSWIEIEGYDAFATARYYPFFYFGNNSSNFLGSTGNDFNNVTYKILFGSSDGKCGYLDYKGDYRWDNRLNHTYYINRTGSSGNPQRALVRINISSINEACYFGILFNYGYELSTGSTISQICDIGRITLLK